MGVEQRPGQYHHLADRRISFIHTARPSPRFPELQARQPHRGDAIVHQPRSTGDIFQPGEVSPRRFDFPAQRRAGELTEGVPQELPRTIYASEEETPEERRRRQRNEARYRWNKRHPEKHREENSRWNKSEKGRKYYREYMREKRRKQKEEQDNERN
jgi:hypothetical protein